MICSGFARRTEDDMAATIKDIARETGLSLATISKYLNGGELREKNRIAVEAAIQKLDYHVNEYARGLKSNRSRTVGVVIPELSNLFITQIVSIVEGVLQERGYSVVICDCRSDEERECRAVQFLLEKRVDAILNMPVCSDGRHLLPALEKGRPIVLLDRPIDALEGQVSCVRIDNESAAALAVNRLLALGHRSIGILAGPREIYTSRMRLKGCRDTLEAHGVEPREELAAFADYTVEGGYRQAARLLREVPDMTALFVSNYEMTLGALIALNERGVRIPQELSLIGFDNLDLARIARPPLTIVSQPLEEIGLGAADLLLGLLSGERTVPTTLALSASLLEGQSVAAPRA